jgi:hypothetical protein
MTKSTLFLECGVIAELTSRANFHIGTNLQQNSNSREALDANSLHHSDVAIVSEAMRA